MKKVNMYSPDGISWKELRNKLFSAQERAETDAKAALLGEIIKARTEKKYRKEDLRKLLTSDNL